MPIFPSTTAHRVREDGDCGLYAALLPYPSSTLGHRGLSPRDLVARVFRGFPISLTMLPRATATDGRSRATSDWDCFAEPAVLPRMVRRCVSPQRGVSPAQRSHVPGPDAFPPCRCLGDQWKCQPGVGAKEELEGDVESSCKTRTLATGVVQ